MPFTRMDQGEIADWMAIGAQVAKRQSAMPAIIKSMLAQLEQQVDGSPSISSCTAYRPRPEPNEPGPPKS